MSTQVQRRKGTTAQHASFTGASAELTVDTTKNTVVVHNGSTAGGFPLAKETGSAMSVTSLTSSGAAVIETTDNTNAALRITQLGTGNALLIEDSASPDSTPVAIDASGRLIVGATSIGAFAAQIQSRGLNTFSAVYEGDDTNPPIFNFFKNRAGATVVAGDDIGRIAFCAYDGVSAYPRAAQMLAEVDATPSATSMPGRLSFSTTSAGATTPTERMRIDSTGAITIAGGTANGVAYLNGSKVLTMGTALTFDGTTLGVSSGSSTPALKLYGAASSQGQLQFGATSGYVIQGGPDYTGLVYNVGSASYQHIFQINGSEQMRLTSTGLGIGTSSPGYKLEVIGSARISSKLLLDTGSAALPSLTFDGWTNTGIYNPAGNSIGFSVNGSERMRIDASGNLLVGVTSASYSVSGRGLIEVNGSSESLIAFKIGGGTTNAVYQYNSSTNFETNVTGSRYYNWTVNGSERMRLDASGNLLVGTTVRQTHNSRSFDLDKTDGALYVNHVNGDPSGNYYFACGYNGNNIGSIAQAGTTGVLYNVTSDYRLKTVIGAVAGSGSRIDALQPSEYEWKADGSRTRGFLAHQFQEVYAGSVTGTKDAVDADGKPVYQAMQASTPEVIADLIAEIQDLRKRLAAAGI